MGVIKHVAVLSSRRSGPKEFLESFAWMEKTVWYAIVFGSGILAGFVLSAFQKGHL